MSNIFKVSLFLGCSLVASHAAAQTSPQAEAPAPETPAIVVTAQNRTQNVQDVPIAINVVSGEALRAAGVTDFTSVERVAPTVQITNEITNTRVSLRGIGTNSNSEAQDQSIAVNIDGEYINRSSVLNASLFDIERLEVLRGPQGTLYGRNATGGAINFITRKPSGDWGVNATATYGNYNSVLIDGGVDVPLGGIGGLRFSGIYSDRDGYVYHPNIGRRSGDDHTVGGRASLRLKPVEGLTADFAVERVESRLVPTAQAFVNLALAGNAPGAGCSGPGYVEVAPLTPGTQCIPKNTNFLRTINPGSYDAPTTGLGKVKQTSTAVRGRLAYDFGAATLTYTGGYRASNQTGSVTLPLFYTNYDYLRSVKTHSHELRLNGESKSLIWQGGVFYFNEKQKFDSGLFAPTIGPAGSYISYTRRPMVELESWAAFAQADVKLTDTLTATGGLRYTNDNRKALYENLGLVFNSGPVRVTQPATAAQTLNLSAEGHKVNWLASLSYKPNPDTLVYGKVATGYKAGGFDAIGNYAPETNTAYEIGSKLNFGPGAKNRFNLSAFYYDYKDLQVAVILDSAVGAQTFNAGSATIWGVEAETEIELSRYDHFSASVNYLHTRYNELKVAFPVLCVGCSTGTVGDLDNNPATITQPDLAGNRLPQAPRWTIALGYDHIFDLGGAGTVTASAFTRFKSEYFADFFNYRDSRQQAYTQTDVNLTYRPVSKNWSIQAFARNLEDKRQLVFGSFVAAGPNLMYNWQFGAPRTYGVRVGVDF